MSYNEYSMEYHTEICYEEIYDWYITSKCNIPHIEEHLFDGRFIINLDEMKGTTIHIPNDNYKIEKELDDSRYILSLKVSEATVFYEYEKHHHHNEDNILVKFDERGNTILCHYIPVRFIENILPEYIIHNLIIYTNSPVYNRDITSNKDKFVDSMLSFMLSKMVSENNTVSFNLESDPTGPNSFTLSFSNTDNVDLFNDRIKDRFLAYIEYYYDNIKELFDDNYNLNHYYAENIYEIGDYEVKYDVFDIKGDYEEDIDD